MIKPVTPKEVIGSAATMPDEVIMAFNNLLMRNCRNGKCIIRQNDAIKEIIKLFKVNGREITDDEIFEQHYLDIESIFIQSGWAVTYDKPGYNESYEPSWKFSEAVK